MADIVVPQIGQLVPKVRVEDELDRGLLGDWRFEGNTGGIVVDHSVYRNHGVIHDSLWVPSRYGATLDSDSGSQDGNSYYVDCGVMKKQPTTVVVIEVFCYQASAYSFHDQRVLSCNNGTGGGGNHYYMLSLLSPSPNESWRMRVRRSGQTITMTTSSGTRDPQMWEHIVFMYDGRGGSADIRCWVNGVVIGEGWPTSGGAIDDPGSSKTYIGANPTDAYGSWPGLIKFARLHNRVVTTEEVKVWTREAFSTVSGAVDLSFLFIPEEVGPPEVNVGLDLDKTNVITHGLVATPTPITLLDKDAGLSTGLFASVSPVLSLGKNAALIATAEAIADTSITLSRDLGYLTSSEVGLILSSLILGKDVGVAFDVDVLAKPQVFLGIDRDVLVAALSSSLADVLFARDLGVGFTTANVFQEDTLLGKISLVATDVDVVGDAKLNLIIERDQQLDTMLSAVASVLLGVRQLDGVGSHTAELVESLLYARQESLTFGAQVTSSPLLQLIEEREALFTAAMTTSALLSLAIELDLSSDWVGGFFAVIALAKTVDIVNAGSVSAVDSVLLNRVEDVLLTAAALVPTDLSLDNVLQIDFTAREASVVSLVLSRGSSLSLLDQVSLAEVLTFSISLDDLESGNVEANASASFTKNEALAIAVSALIDEGIQLDRTSLVTFQATEDLFLVGIVDAQLTIRKLYTVNLTTGKVGDVDLTVRSRTKH